MSSGMPARVSVHWLGILFLASCAHPAPQEKNVVAPTPRPTAVETAPMPAPQATTCDQDTLKTCIELGVAIENSHKDVWQAAQLYQKACDGGELMGCVHLGALHETGTGIEQDMESAMALYRKACDA